MTDTEFGPEDYPEVQNPEIPVEIPVEIKVEMLRAATQHTLHDLDILKNQFELQGMTLKLTLATMEMVANSLEILINDWNERHPNNPFPIRINPADGPDDFDLNEVIKDLIGPN